MPGNACAPQFQHYQPSCNLKPQLNQIPYPGDSASVTSMQGTLSSGEQISLLIKLDSRN